MATNTNNSAEQEYTKRASDIARLIDVLQMELERHAEAAKADAKNWGHHLRASAREYLLAVLGWGRLPASLARLRQSQRGRRVGVVGQRSDRLRTTRRGRTGAERAGTTARGAA